MQRMLMLRKHRSALLLCLFTCVIFESSSSYAQTESKKAKQSGISFVESSWSVVLKKASVEHKYVFVDAYASWCGPCKLLKATTFKNREVAAFFNQNFVNLSIDMEKQEGPALATKWNIQAYPTLIIFDATGKPLVETVGFLGAKDLLKFGKQALTTKE